MSKSLILTGLLALSLNALAQDKEPVTFHGIGCMAIEAVSGAKPFLMITEITETSALIRLQLDSEIAEAREVKVVKPKFENGKKVVSYESVRSFVDDGFDRPDFSFVDTDGSTRQDTTKGTLILGGRAIPMECWDGMDEKAQSAAE